MRQIPFTKSVIVTGSEREQIAKDFANAAIALDDSAKLNYTLLADFTAAQARARELAGVVMTASESMQQIMQINLLVSGALGAIRARASEVDNAVDDASELAEFVEQTAVALEAALAEFDSGEALA